MLCIDAHAKSLTLQVDAIENDFFLKYDTPACLGDASVADWSVLQGPCDDCRLVHTQRYATCWAAKYREDIEHRKRALQASHSHDQRR
jgi:hypothetical protein